MTFEEFFNKKRIDLVALRAAEPGLFAEFEKHFTQMGEKSFDHTKKYWFNKLRLQYHLAPEKKPEKMHLENRLAEQTVVETLTDSIPAPSTGFKPRFKPGMTAKPAEPIAEQKEITAVEQPAAENPAESTAPKPGFKPRFNAKMVAPKPVETDEAKPGNEPVTEIPVPLEGTVPKPGFKPRFNMKMAAPKPAEADEAKPEAEPIAEIPPAPESTAPKPGFKPRFNMKAMAPKSIEEKTESEQPAVEDKPVDIAEPTPTAEEAPAAPKIGFKPRFNAKTMTPKPAEAAEAEKAEHEPVAAENKPADVTELTSPAEEAPAAPKVGFKPRFNAKTTKPQPPQE